MESKNNWKAWLYLAPVLILMAVFTIYPLINTIGISFLKDYNYMTTANNGFTFDNYGVVLGITSVKGVYMRDIIDYAIPNTLIIVFVTVPLSIIIALLIAVGLNSIKFLQKIFQTIFFIPYVTNAIAVGMVFSVIFDVQGIWNFLFNLGEKYWINGYATQASAMFALIVYIIWHSLPFKILIFLSGLQNIDKQYYQAAQVDAAGRFKTLMKITVPLLSPQILYSLVTSFIGAFKEYTSVVALIGGPGTGGTNNMLTIVYYIYNCIPGQVAYGAAAAVLLFIVILIFTAIQMQVSKTRVHY